MAVLGTWRPGNQVVNLKAGNGGSKMSQTEKVKFEELKKG